MFTIPEGFIVHHPSFSQLKKRHNVSYENGWCCLGKGGSLNVFYFEDGKITVVDDNPSVFTETQHLQEYTASMVGTCDTVLVAPPLLCFQKECRFQNIESTTNTMKKKPIGNFLK